MDMSQRALPPYLFSPRGGSNEWLHHPRVIAAWRRGAQAEVPPLTVEFACVLACDAMCPTCPYNRSRSRLGDGARAADGAPSDDRHAASWKTTQQILEAAHDAGATGILFTGGGEPLIWEHLPAAMALAAKLRMSTSLYTNGLRLGLDTSLASILWDPEHAVSFIRVSVNAVSPSVVRRHWGRGFDVEQQLHGLRLLVQARDRWAQTYQRMDQPLPSIQISTIVDRHNVGDLPQLLRVIAEIFDANSRCRGTEDAMIVRPLVIHGRMQGYQPDDHSEAVITSIVEVARPGGCGHGVLGDAGMPLFLGFGLSHVNDGAAGTYGAVIEEEYAWRTRNPVNLANGIFLTVGPSGDVYPSTEHNCDGAWAIGSLLEHSVADIYKSRRRAAMLDQLNRQAWQASVAQPFARTNRLARIAASIAGGSIDDPMLDALRRRDTAAGRRGILLD